MSTVTDRRERERAQRHQLIITTARELAEAEGWEAVTTRRLAELVEYSQPVLYSHFAGKDAILRAVAVEGFGELADRLRRARLASPEPPHALHAVCRAYLRFATEHPALYEAMFVRPTDMGLAYDETPPQLRAGFNELVSCFRPDDPHRELLAQLAWSALHGFAALAGSGRIPPGDQAERLDLLVARLAGTPGAPTG